MTNFPHLNQAVLRVSNLGKRYRLFASPRQRLQALLGLSDHSHTHWALQEVGFELQRGQCLGVIGDNGAGKSTLLKLLAGTLQPSHGHIHRLGRLTAILELGAGFHPDFTGRDNLMFGGSFIGLSQTDMLSLAEEIVDFSELGDAIDRPVKTYSSGMVVRLAFALVTAVQPEVLIIDEALSVGDQHFQKKCVQRIATFRQQGCTILFCSHSLYHVRQLCDRVLWLDQGRMRGLGDTESVLSAYEAHVRRQEAGPLVSVDSTTVPDGKPVAQSVTKLPSSQRASLLAARVTRGVEPQPGTAGALDEITVTDSDLVIEVQALSVSGEVPSIGVMLEQLHGVGITSVATHADGVVLTALSSDAGITTWKVTLTFPQLALHSGQYCLSFYLFDAQGLVVYDEWKDHIQFHWVSPSLTPGLVHLPHQWS